MCSSAPEEDALHALLCKHATFNNYRNEIISHLQVKILPLLDADMLPLCLLEWLLDEECSEIDGLPAEVMNSLSAVGKRGVWFGFLPTLFMKWIKWKYESTKWLVAFMSSCLESLHKLWIERCHIVHESLSSNAQIEDHHHLLQQVRLLFQQADAEVSNVLHQCKHRLHRLSTETLRGIAHQLLSDLGADSTATPFHTDINNKNKRAWRSLTPEVVLRRDQATVRRHQQMKRNKRRRDEFEDMVESKRCRQRR